MEEEDFWEPVLAFPDLEEPVITEHFEGDTVWWIQLSPRHPIPQEIASIFL